MENTNSDQTRQTKEETQQSEGNQASRWDVAVKGGITLGVLLFLWASQANNRELSTEVVALIVLAIIPWLSSILESIELPGGGGVKFRKQIQREVNETKQEVAVQKKTIGNQGEKLALQQQIVNELVVYSMSHLIFKLLAGLKQANDQGGEYLYQGDVDAFARDLRYLRDHGYLNHFHIRPLQQGQNLVGVATLTPAGNLLVDLRQQMDRQKQQEKVELASRMTK